MGDYSRKLDRYTNVSIGYTILAATDYTTAQTIIAAVAGTTLYIQKIAIGVTVDNAATQLFQDSSGTPIEIAKTKASPGLGPILFDFGPEGYPLTEGKAFQHKMSAAGMAASIMVTAYRRVTGTQAA